MNQEDFLNLFGATTEKERDSLKKIFQKISWQGKEIFKLRAEEVLEGLQENWVRVLFNEVILPRDFNQIYLNGVDSVTTLLNSKEVVAIAECLKERKKPLHTLDLSCNEIGLTDGGKRALTTLFAALKESPVTNLLLEHNNLILSEVAGMSVFLHLKDNQTLEFLSLSNNTFNDNCVAGLAWALQSNCTLKTLNLSNNGLSGKVNFLVDLIERNTSITKLDLSENYFSPEGKNNLLEALCKNSSLLELDFSTKQNFEHETQMQEEEFEQEEQQKMLVEMLRLNAVFKEEVGEIDDLGLFDEKRKKLISDKKKIFSPTPSNSPASSFSGKLQGSQICQIS